MNFKDVTKQIKRLSAKGRPGSFIDIPTVAIPRNEPRLNKATGQFETVELRLVKLSRKGEKLLYTWYWYNPYGCKSSDIPIPPVIADALFGVGEKAPRWFVIWEQEHQAIRWLVERDAPCSGEGLTAEVVRSLFWHYAAGGEMEEPAGEIAK